MATTPGLTTPDMRPAASGPGMEESLGMSIPAAHAEIVVDLAAIRRNVRILRDLVAADGAQLMTIVKADAYGHGLVPCAAAARLAGADWLGVATSDEALALRAAGDEGPLLCWLGVPGEAYAELVREGIDVTAYSLAELDEIDVGVRTAGRPARLQLKVDTGLNRGGAALADWPALVAAARAGEEAGRWQVTGIWSHFACSDEPDHRANDTQEQAFREALVVAEEAGLRPEVRHLANSAAAILRPSSRFDLVRCGLASYGLDPAPGHTPDLGLVPAMTVRSALAMVKSVAARCRRLLRPHVGGRPRDHRRAGADRVRRRRAAACEQQRRDLGGRQAPAGPGPGLHGPVRGRPGRRAGSGG